MDDSARVARQRGQFPPSAPHGSGMIGINGAAAHLVHAGDLVIIMSYCVLEDAAARALKPRIVHVDDDNRIVRLGKDPAEPVPGAINQKRAVAAA